PTGWKSATSSSSPSGWHSTARARSARDAPFFFVRSSHRRRKSAGAAADFRSTLRATRKKQERSARECVPDESLRRGGQGAADRRPDAREVASMSADVSSMPRLGWPTKALYGLSAFGTTIKAGLSGLTLFFYTQLIGLD